MTTEELQHAIQSGVAQKMSLDSSETDPKHLRVGVNSAMCDHAALVKVLIDEGVLTFEGYQAARQEVYTKEVQMYERWLSNRIGMQVSLR